MNNMPPPDDQLTQDLITTRPTISHHSITYKNMLLRKTSRFTKIIIGILSIVIVFSVSYYFALSSTPNITPIMKKPNATQENMSNISDKIDIVYYINLDHRNDRKTQFLEEMSKISFPQKKIERIPATYLKERGHLGASLSHIKTIETFLQSQHDICMIFEDDFEFSREPSEVTAAIQEIFDNNIDFDMVMLSANIYDEEDIPQYEFIKKVKSAATASGFILTRDFAPILLENLKEGAKKLENSYNERTYITNVSKHEPDRMNYDGQYALDHYWISIQANNKWFVFSPKLGKQRNSYSDIMEGNVAYNL